MRASYRLLPLLVTSLCAVLLAEGAHPDTRALAAPRPVGVRADLPSVQIQAQPVYQGCNDIVVHALRGTAWREVVSHFSDPPSVYAVWHYDNTLQRYQGIYFSDPRAPVDGPAATAELAFAIFACVSHDGSVS